MNPYFEPATLIWVGINCLLAGGAVLVLRAMYRWIQDRAILSRGFAMEGDEGDIMTHLIAIDLVRQNGHRIPRETPQFLCSTGFDYPALFHKLLSYIPRKYLERGEWLISPGFEAGHAALVCFAAWFALAHAGAGSNAPALALIVAAGWAVTPLLTRNPRRGSVLGERCFGYTFGHTFLFCLAMLTATAEPLWLVPAAIVFSVAAASSKFALQAMVFIGVAFAAVRLDPLPLAALAVSAVAAVALSLGYVVRVVSGTVDHSRFYRSFMVRVHDYTSSFSSRDLAKGVALLLRGRFREGIASIKRHPIHRLPALVPWLLPFALFLVSDAPESSVASVLVDWTWAALIVTALTAGDTLKFLGEAERYMEFALFPLIVLSVLVPSPVGPTVLFAILAYCLFRLGVVYATPVRVSSASPETLELVRWFAARPPSTVLTVPGRLSYPLLYRTAHRAVWCFTNTPRGEQRERWKSLFEPRARYPYVAPSALARAHAEFGVDMIVVDKAGADAAAQYWNLAYDWQRFRVLFENARYAVVDAARAAAEVADTGGIREARPRQEGAAV